ncbi:SMC family ATPase [Actinobacteria bacterium YIM 96077]|uniref:Nuclease SbcCD subunit C n=1 Tax=Phytoactinopolyspora halophila TaxID=1981511 RepID=A0A329QPE6_9ACTN|nr:SMC family ATPase [Phytoactinopolyspora halophila]AYY15024.1 SMC family ATPase [Actinobacteria bacterium YIM 96077]RAW14210.1 hypothetical protein DPM12_11170 [Phytoactinopolyspora halophila]
MHLHELTFAALGPFRDEQHIDFRELTAGGLFLLDGPTGAGKSTIIDALVFALYGQVAGGNSSKHRLVSDHRDRNAEPFVELVFETGRGIFRVRRTPEFERPKKRGEGTVTQQASVKLWKATSPDGLDGDPLSTRAGEADAEILEAIGLTREQFVKTVVLPQGEFARFLESKSDERRDILQRIFGTEHYEQVQEDLRRRRVAARQECDRADQQVRFATESFVDGVGLDDDGARAVSDLTEVAITATARERDEADAVLLARIVDIHTGLETQHQACELRHAEVEATRHEAANHLHELEQHRERRDRLRAARAAKDQLEAERSEQEERERRLDAGRRAARCESSIHALDDVRGRLDTAQRRVEDLRATVELPGIDVATARHQDVSRTHRELRDIVIGLEDVLEVEARLPDRRDQLTTLQRDRTKLAANLETIESRCTALPAEIASVETELDAARKTAASLDSLRHERTGIHELLSVHDALVAARHQHESAETAHQDALRRLAEASELESDLRRRYLAGIAAEIADELVDGEPCRVCGATEHPAPATRAAGDVTREQVESAEQARKEREHERDARQQDVTRASTRVAELEGRLDGHTDDELRRRLSETDAAIDAAETAQQRVGELGENLDRHRQELDDLTEERRQAAADIAGVDAQITALSEAIDRDEARVASERAGFSTIAARVADLERRAHAAEQLASALADVERHADEHTRREREVDEVITAAGFPTEDDARSALLPAAELDDLETAVQDWSRRMHEVDGRLAAPDLVGVDPDAHIDVTAARTELDRRDGEFEELQRAMATSDQRLERSHRARAKIVDALLRRRQRYAESEALIRVAGLVNADSPDNALRMPLATYVLQRVFDGVVDAANERLVEMSSGRYALESHEGKQAGSRRTGLGLRVVDAHTGHARGTDTLSGGETFYVSLALALGLADVVTAQAGGLRMGTLFIDEGFGSLDPDTLDNVMGVLADLRSGGRSVGVVSHVEELKTRIPERIEVRRPSASGPSTLHVIA